MLYFAYGSNMKHRQMKQRCPSSRFIKRVYREGYRFVYDGYSSTWKGPVANIVKSQNSIVWGGLFEINEDNLAALDCYEGYPKSYDREIAKVKDDKGTIYDAINYLRKGEKVGAPHTAYQKRVIQGAKDCELPKDYIKCNL